MPKEKVSKARIFEEQYPYISHFVEVQGWIEIGYDENVSAFVKAYDEGGTVFEGEDDYASIDEALADLEAGVKEYMEECGIE